MVEVAGKKLDDAKDGPADRDFSKPDFNVSEWKRISVSSNWEPKGFAEPEYALDLETGRELYQHTFRLPAGWPEARRVCLRFEGVTFGFEGWHDGREFGNSSANACNPNTFNITDFSIKQFDAKEGSDISPRPTPH